jgi:hypothetical protein
VQPKHDPTSRGSEEDAPIDLVDPVHRFPSAYVCCFHPSAAADIIAPDGAGDSTLSTLDSAITRFSDMSFQSEGAGVKCKLHTFSAANGNV